MTPLIRPEPYALLQRGLDEAIQADPALEAVRRQFLLPVQLLDAIAAQAVATLADDPLAQERLRYLVTSARAHALPPAATEALTPAQDNTASPPPAPPARARKRGKGSTAQEPPALLKEPFARASPPGLLHLGWLVLTGLAAGRAGKLVQLETPFLRTVHGLALASCPADILASAVASGLSGAHLRVLLSALSSPRAPEAGDSSGLSHVIAGFLVSPIQRTRWESVTRIFSWVEHDSQEVQWEGASADGIIAVSPRAGCPGSPLRIQGRFPRELVAALEEGTRHVVFAAHRQSGLLEARLIEAQPTSPPRPGSDIPSEWYHTLIVEVPQEVRPGWLGFTHPSRAREVDEVREQLREAWRERNGLEPSLAETPVPLELLPPLPPRPAPPLPGPNAFRGGRPRIVSAQLAPQVVDPEGTLALEWEAEGVDAATVRSGEVNHEGQPPLGRLELKAPARGTSATVQVLVRNGCGEARQELSSRLRVRILSVMASPEYRESRVLVEGEPFLLRVETTAPVADVQASLRVGDTVIAGQPSNGSLRFRVPGELAFNGLSGTITVGPATSAAVVDDTKPLPTLTFVRPIRVVLLRMAILEMDGDTPTLQRVSQDRAWEALVTARETLGIAVEKVDAFWLDDAALVTGRLEDPESSGAERLLERLARLAALHPGFEDAVWVALLPGTAPVARHAPAEAAARVAVATAGQLAQVLPTEVTRRMRTRVVRLVGTLGSEASITLEPPREEVRSRGQGAPIDSGLVAVALDGEGREMSERAIRTTRALGTRGFATLLPVSEETAEVELRLLGRTVHRLARPAGVPRLESVALSASTLSWTVEHSRAARCHLTVEMQWAGGWCPVASLGPCCETEHLLSTTRLAPYESGEERPELQLRLVVTDGWNTAEKLVTQRLEVSWLHLALRDAGEGRYWADVTDGLERRTPPVPPPTWSLGSRTGTGFAFVARPEESGTLTLSVAGLQDTTTVGEPDDDNLRD